MSHELNKSKSFELLAKRQRRLLLRIVQEASAPLPMAELAKQIGEREYDNPSTSELESIRLSLFHNHVPKLERADVVMYYEDEDTVYTAENFAALVGMLKKVENGGIPRTRE